MDFFNYTKCIVIGLETNLIDCNINIIYKLAQLIPTTPNPIDPVMLLLLILILVSSVQFAKNIIHVVILLLMTYVITGIFFIRLGFDFLGYMVLIIYAGAIIILFIFVLMLIEMKNFKNKTELTNKFFYFSYIVILFIVLNILIYNFSYFSIVVDLDNFNKFKDMHALKLMLIFQFFNKTTNLVEMSPLVKTAYVLFSLSWFETILIGFILLLALVFIIYLFKK
jgi:NADH:ubiquinone oxidoreductase subunit 6 (subunit J)